MKSKFKTKALASVLITSLVYSPTQLALAEESKNYNFDEVCADVIQKVNNGDKMEGDQRASYCIQAEIADKSIKWEKTKKLVYWTAGGIALTTYGIEKLGKWQIKSGIKEAAIGKTEVDIGKIEFTAAFDTLNAPAAAVATKKIAAGEAKVAAGEAKMKSGESKVLYARTTCPLLAIGAGASNFIIDGYGKYKINQTKAKYGQATESWLDMGTLVGLGMSAVSASAIFKGNKNMPSIVTNSDDFGKMKEALCEANKCTAESFKGLDEQTLSKTEVSNDELNKKSGCLMTGLGLVAFGGLSAVSEKSLEATKQSNVNNAGSIKMGSEKAITSFSSKVDAIDKKGITKPSNGAGSVEGECASSSGNAYLSCLGTQSPEIAAISNNPDFIREIERNLGGKTLGDFAKGYKGKSDQDMANYISGTIGGDPSILAQSMKDHEKMAMSAGGDLSSSIGSPLTYNRSSGGSVSRSRGGSDFDFNKLMSGMLGSLNMGKGTDQKTGAAEAVFRKLDLLPVEEIQQNKDISLFARIAYRYRKNSNNLDPTLKSEQTRELSSEKK